MTEGTLMNCLSLFSLTFLGDCSVYYNQASPAPVHLQIQIDVEKLKNMFLQYFFLLTEFASEQGKSSSNY